MKGCLFIHISGDPVTLAYEENIWTLPFRDLERVFPYALGEILHNHDISDSIVVNGPGSFTTLRIGCVALNTVQMLSKTSYTFWSRTKPDLYGLLVTQGFLPSYGIFSIGQQKKLRGKNYENKEITFITKETIATLPDNYFFEVPEHHSLAGELDENAAVSMQRTKEGLKFLYQHKEHIITREQLMDGTKKTTYLIPDYMIEPQIG